MEDPPQDKDDLSRQAQRQFRPYIEICVGDEIKLNRKNGLGKPGRTTDYSSTEFFYSEEFDPGSG